MVLATFEVDRKGSFVERLERLEVAGLCSQNGFGQPRGFPVENILGSDKETFIGNLLVLLLQADDVQNNSGKGFFSPFIHNLDRFFQTHGMIQDDAVGVCVSLQLLNEALVIVDDQNPQGSGEILVQWVPPFGRTIRK